ncbi:hypothetical protein ABL78_7421 [Leptomonas seymouri]|uniref:EF-hand domain-containing protein n=1 Tax=Leptomonas seymouri TaxID=5684 RepID=A0A0N0P2Z3_LEPSE|nr:hypothetical protein ABL78_7421 [Leptomonas seymouri]|eukprot:KPI83536.1 hypothetical protein ABL78_7421 [Leptomonas seymouri]
MSVVEADLVVRIRVSAKTGKLSVLSEDVDLRILERSAAAGSDPRMLFLKSCVNLHGLPRLSLTQQGCGFIDYLPLLDSALYRRIREPLHFMKLVLGLCADFGSPIELSVSCKSLSAADSPQISPARRTAVFCVVDSASSVAFTVGLHYYSGEELPSIETTCTQYMDYQHDVPLSMKVKYPKACAAMPKDDDGFLDVEEVRLAMVHGVMEAIALSMTAAA